jgi:phospholipid/cholesterol/gamma-HCH transport system substrate-binding protein
VILVAAGVLGALLLLTGRTGATDTYYAVYDNVGGVKIGTPVQVEGYQVGEVDGVEPAVANGELRFRVALSIERGFPVPADGQASIASAGLLSGAAISITGGSASARLSPGEEIATAPPRDIMSAVSNLAGTVGQLSEDGVGPLLATLNRAAGELETVLSESAPVIARSLERTGGSLSSISARLEEEVLDAETLRGLTRTLANIEQASETLNRDMLNAENAEQLSRSLQNLGDMSRSAVTLTEELAGMSNRLDQLLRQLEKLARENEATVEASLDDLRFSLATVARRIDAITYNVETTSRNMSEFSRQIRRNPSLLLRGGGSTAEAE